MKAIFSGWRDKDDSAEADAAPAGDGDGESVLFQKAYEGMGLTADEPVTWEARFAEIGARASDPGAGIQRLQALWLKDSFMANLGADAMLRMKPFLEFATAPANREVIRQDEYGNFMVVLLSGSMAVDRIQPWGEHLRLAETRPGDILGEMSLLDSGIRFSACTPLVDSEIGVLTAHALDEMMVKEPQLAAAFIGLLARKLSLRLRVVSARLSDGQK